MIAEAPGGAEQGGTTAGATAARAPAKLARSPEGDELLALLAHTTVDYAAFVLDPDGNVLTWNAGAEHLTGTPAGEIVGRHLGALYPREALEDGTPEQDLAIAVADGHLEGEGWRLRHDGSMFWADVDITALRGEDHRLVGFGVLMRDLTERRRGDELLRDSEERFRLLVNSVSDYAIFLLDPDGIITSWNLGAERLKGYRADEILGRHFSRFYTHDDLRRDLPGTALRTAMEQGRFDFEGWRVRKDGTRFWANVVITALRGADGEHRGFAKVTKDLTDRKRNEDALRGVLARERDAAAQLREVDRMRSEVVGLIAHDLRAPLGVIQSLVHLLTEDWATLTEAEKLAHLERIAARAVTMGSLVDDVADVARIEAGQLETEHVPFDVEEVLTRAINDVVPPASRDVRTDVAPDVTAIGDPRRTWQVISNLLSNAVKFSPSDTPIEVVVARDGSEIVTSVRDQGCGIPAEQHHRLFQRFSRLSSTSGAPGSGVGLYIAKALVEAQHGRMWLTSAADAGSTFSFSLPAAT